jgi:hypothetical protein
VLLGGISGRVEGERKRILRGEEDQRMLHTYVHIKHTYVTQFEKGGKEKGIWEFSGGVSLLKVYYIHLWNLSQ